MAARNSDYDELAWFYNRYWGASFADRFLSVIGNCFCHTFLPRPASSICAAAPAIWRTS
jgi:hypothetical protein